jgi:hypothetical protein
MARDDRNAVVLMIEAAVGDVMCGRGQRSNTGIR